MGGASAMGRGLQPMVEVTEDAMEEYQYDMDEDFQVKQTSSPHSPETREREPGYSLNNKDTAFCFVSRLSSSFSSTTSDPSLPLAKVVASRIMYVTLSVVNSYKFR